MNITCLHVSKFCVIEDLKFKIPMNYNDVGEGDLS